jgi:asparagine synthase (glutamine-hydrolysing)
MIKEEPERANELLSQLYPWKENIASNTVFLNAFLGEYNADLPYSSHIPRWNTTSRIKHFMLADHPNQYLIDRNLYDIKKPLHRAQYIEYHTLLAGYLLASQGDRVLMANSVEGRYPFLDHRLIEFCNTLPDAMKLNDRNKIMREKDILYTTTESIVPDIIRHRRKKPYMAPDAACFVNDDNTKRLLSEAITKEYGYFNAKKVALLFKKGEAGKITGFSDNMAFIGILSTHILHELFLKHYGSYHESVDNLHVNKKGD